MRFIIHNHHFNSEIWNDFKPRPDDIVVATYGKSGTTWMQQILAQLIFNGSEDVCATELSPWLDLRVPPAEVKLAAVEAQTHRRFLKTHLPLDALVFHPTVRYIVCCRDGRDVAWSLHNHHLHATDAWYDAVNNSPGLVGDPVPRAQPDPKDAFLTWLRKDGAPFWPYFSHIASWWAVKDLPNVLLVHYADMKRDLEGTVRRVAAFLGIDASDDLIATTVSHSTFTYMKANASAVIPVGGLFWAGGAKRFIHKGTNKRWEEALGEEEIAEYFERAREELPPDCVEWLCRS